MEKLLDQWLVRTSENLIEGPYPREQICQMILKGQLGLQDEVCQANHYWIFINEREEVRCQLGIEVPITQATRSDDVTETQISNGEEEEITDAGISNEASESFEKAMERSQAMQERDQDFYKTSYSSSLPQKESRQSLGSKNEDQVNGISPIQKVAWLILLVMSIALVAFFVSLKR